jgi:hypothetical protein
MHSSRTDRGSLLEFAMVALAAALVISGCAGTVSSVPPPSSPSTPLPATAQLSVTPSSVSVNSTVGVMGSQSVSASNTGTAALTVSQVQISGTGFALSGITAPVSLTPAQSQSFSVTFDSSTTGTVTGKLTLMTSAADERAVWLSLADQPGRGGHNLGVRQPSDRAQPRCVSVAPINLNRWC